MSSIVPQPTPSGGGRSVPRRKVASPLPVGSTFLSFFVSNNYGEVSACPTPLPISSSRAPCCSWWYFSALTWAVVLAKALQQWRVKRDNRGFPEAYRPSAGLPSRGEVAKYRGPTARVAAAGIDAWNDASETIGHDEDLEVRRDVLERSLRQQLQKERRGIESGLAVLASIGTTAPFVGLFGTVWGIIHALAHQWHGLGEPRSSRRTDR